MKTRPSCLGLGLLLTISAALAASWIQAHGKQAALQQSITSIQAQLDESNRTSSEYQNATRKLSAEIAALETALGNSPGALEQKRRASALAVIESLKAAHANNPPISRPKPPPMGPTGSRFPELLADPEYNQLYAQEARRLVKWSQGPKLKMLGLSTDVFEKVVSVLAEQEMAFTDYGALTGNAGIRGDFYKKQKEITDRQLLDLMGEDAFKRWQKITEVQTVFVPNANGNGGRGYSMQSHEALVTEANQYLTPKLALRLSYSDAPLQKEQASQLAEILANSCTAPGTRIYQAMFSEPFIQQAAQVLSPTQIDALKQLKAEQDASTKRGKLPKSSELPRNATPAK